MKAKAVKSSAVPKAATNETKHKGGYHRRSLDVRIHEIDVVMVSTLRLITQREDIIKRDKETLARHQALLLTSKEKMDKLAAKRDRLIQERDHPLSKEEKEKLRLQRKQEEAKISQLLQTLTRSGKTIDDLLDDLAYQNLKGDSANERSTGINESDH